MNNQTDLRAALKTAWEKKLRLDAIMSSAQKAQAEKDARKFFIEDFGVEPDNVCGYRCRQGEIEVELVLDPQYSAWRAWALVGICPICQEKTISNEQHPNTIYELYPLLTHFVPSTWHTCQVATPKNNPLDRIANALERLISAEEANIAIHSPTSLLDTLENLINSPMPPMDTLENLLNEN